MRESLWRGSDQTRGHLIRKVADRGRGVAENEKREITEWAEFDNATFRMFGVGLSEAIRRSRQRDCGAGEALRITSTRRDVLGAMIPAVHRRPAPGGSGLQRHVKMLGHAVG